MNAKPICSKTPTIDIERYRYDELIQTETRYHLLVGALIECEGYTNIDELKKHFGIPTKVHEIGGEIEE